MKQIKDKQKVYKIRRIVALALIVFLVCLIIFGVQKRNKTKKLALGENALNIAGEELDLRDVLGDVPNDPHLGAGMIPIKWNGTNWVITTKDDKDWYNYSEGKWANIMLSDRLL